MGFIEDIYNNGYYPSEQGQPEQTDEYQQAQQRVQEYTEKIIDSLGDGGEQLFDEYLSAKADEVSFEMATAFKEGVAFATKIFVESCRK